MQNRNVILAIAGTKCYLDKSDTGYWITRNYDKLSLRFEDEAEARWFVGAFHKGDQNLVPTYIEVERYFNKVA